MDNRRRSVYHHYSYAYSAPSTTSYPTDPSVAWSFEEQPALPAYGVDTVGNYAPVSPLPDPSDELQGLGGHFEPAPATEDPILGNPHVGFDVYSTWSAMLSNRNSMSTSFAGIQDCFPDRTLQIPVGHNDDLHSTAAIPPNLPVQRSAAVHTSTQDNGAQRVVCEWDGCDKDFSRAPDMKRHLRYQHARRGSFPCPRCSRICNRKDNLKDHMRTHRKQ